VRLFACLMGLLVPVVSWATKSPRPPQASERLYVVGRHDPGAGYPGRFERAFADRKRRLAQARGANPAAVLPLLAAVDLLYGEIETERLAAWLDAVAIGRRRHPLVRAFAASQRARLDEMAGDPRAGAKRLRSIGYVLDWLFVGPFEYAGTADLDAPHPCRSEPFSSTRSFEGAVPGEPLVWRRYDYEAAPDGGFVGFDDYLSPNEKVFACAVTWVHLDRAEDVSFRLGTGGAYRLFAGDREIARGDVRRLAHPLQDVAAARLAAGWHRLTLLIANEHEPWGFYVRLARLDGAPVPGLAVATHPPDDGRLAEAAPAARAPVALRAILQARAASGKVGDVLDLAELEWRTHPYAREDTRTVDRLRRVEPTAEDFRASRLRAHVETDESVRARVLERAVEVGRKAGVGPRIAPLLLELAFRAEGLGLRDEARRLLDEAFEAAPDDVYVELARVDALAESGFEQQALAWSLDVLDRWPNSSIVRHGAAARLAAAGRKVKAMEILAGGPTSAPVERSRYLALALETGRVDEALSRLLAWTAAEPGRPRLFVRLAWTYDAAGRPDDAWSAMGRALQLAPLDPDLHAEAARMALRQGHKAAAMVELRRSIELRPQQPELRELLSALDANARRDTFARYGLDLERIARMKIPARWARRPAVVLARRVAVDVYDNGLTERLDHRIVAIQDDRGARERSVVSTYYDPSLSYVDVRRARVRHRDGTVEDMGRVLVTSLSEAGYRMYYDRRRVDVVFDRLEPGDVVEVAFVTHDVAARNMFDTYFGDLQPVQGIDPILRYEYVVTTPPSLPLIFDAKDIERGRDGARLVARYTRSNLAPIDPEAHMPGWTDVAAYLHASSYESWDDVADWYWRLVRDQLVADDRIRAAVAEAVRGIDPSDGLARMEAIYDYVVRNTRYVGLEFGIHGYKPYPTTEVFARRFGDCKDKAALLKVMLAEVGIASHMVLVRTRDLGGIDAAPASLAVFNHAIVYVPTYDRYLDATAEWSGPTELPVQDQGAVVLHVLDGKGARFRRIPFAAPEANRTTISGTIRLDRRGGGDMKLDVAVVGPDAAVLRRTFHAEEQRRERAAALLAGLFGVADVRSVTARGVADVRTAVGLSVEAHLASIAAVQQGRLRVPVVGHEVHETRAWAAKAQRRYPLSLGVPNEFERRIEFVAPPGYRFAGRPDGGRVEHTAVHGELTVAVDETGRRAVVVSRIRYETPQIDPEDYPAFRRALQRIDALHGQTFVLERAR